MTVAAVFRLGNRVLRGGACGQSVACERVRQSDEYAEDIVDGQIRSLGFTGAFVGLWAWDLTGGGLHAYSDGTTYRVAD
jgi:xylan 1,4-beta-xylosidase